MILIIYIIRFLDDRLLVMSEQSLKDKTIKGTMWSATDAYSGKD